MTDYGTVNFYAEGFGPPFFLLKQPGTSIGTATRMDGVIHGVNTG